MIIIYYNSYIEHIKNQTPIALTSSPPPMTLGCSRCPDAIRFHSEANRWSALVSKPRVVEAIGLCKLVTITPIGLYDL